MSWVIEEGSVMKVISQVPPGITTYPSRKKAREVLRGKPRDTVDAYLERLAGILGVASNDPTQIQELIKQRVEELKAELHHRDIRVGNLEEEQHELQWQKDSTDRLNSDLRVKIEGLETMIQAMVHPPEFIKIQEQLKQARMEVWALELKAEALHCHQVMLASQREQLRKQLVEATR